MQRRTRAFLVACAVVFAVPAVHPGHVVASPVDEQRREVERIVDELERLEERSDILTEDYVVAIDEKNRLDAEVAAAAEQVAAKEAELDQLRGELSEVAVRAFTGAGTDVLGPLFSNAGAYNDTLQRDQYSRVALSVGTVTSDDLDELVAELQDERAELEEKQAQAAALAEQIESQQGETDALRQEYLQRRAEAEAELGQLIAEEEQRRAEEAFRRMQAEAAAAPQPAPATGGNSAGNGDGGGNGGDTGGADDGGDDGGSDGGGAAPAPAPAPSDYPAPSGLAGVAIQAAMSQLGVPYVYATSSPGVSFDCSGLTKYAWGQAGVSLPHQSRAQAAMLPHVPPSEAQPGDLIFYYDPISHVGIYLGGGQLVHAPNSGTVVKVATVNWGKVAVVARPG